MKKGIFNFIKGVISVVFAMTILLPLGCMAQQKESSSNDKAKASKIVSGMTLDQKISQLHGTQNSDNYRIVIGIPALGIPDLPLANGPAGLGPAGPGHQGKATALPAPISLAATWDTSAARLFGEVSGKEAADLGNVLLEAPDVNIARTPHNGRTFEGFGEDPYLTSQIAVADIKGIQSQGVMANVKHYAANNQETNRLTIDEIISKRALREIYLPAFEASVKEGHVASVMAAYNKVNGYHCTENGFLLDTVLKKEWRFQGFVTSDFGAVHSTVGCALNGLDLELPSGIYFGNALKEAVENGQVPMSVINDKLVRRFSTMMHFGLWDKKPEERPIPAGADALLAKRIGEEGVVLLKNEEELLPLNPSNIHSVAVIGPTSAYAMTGGGGSSKVSPILTVTPEEGLKQFLGNGVTIHIDDGKNIGHSVILAKSSDAVILILNDFQTEARDHPISLSGDQDSLAWAVLEANPHTIVVLKTGGPVLMPWIRQAHAVLEAWYPGEEDGNIVASVIFGKTNPSGKLPITFPASEKEMPLQSPEQYPGVDGKVYYADGVMVGYRWYDDKEVAPLFPFGYGLSYTTFAYKNLRIKKEQGNKVSVEFMVTNTGKIAGAEVAQLYIGMPSSTGVPQPPRQLKGFCRLELKPGQSAKAVFFLNDHDLSYWDKKAHGWKIMAGTYQVYAAASSRDIRLKGSFREK